MCAIFCVCNGSFKVFAIYLAFKYFFNEYHVQKFKLGVSFYRKMQLSNTVFIISIYGNYVLDLSF